MKVPIKWLKDYIDFDITAKELGDALTLSGSNVEEVITTGDEISKVVTGKILSIVPHPDAEKLVICQVEVGEKEPIQIVTGADNMKEGDIVPTALHGSSLPGIKIKKGKLRGVTSNGMMCAAEELGIEEENPVHGLMILPKDTPVGKDIKAVLDLDSAVIDFEITSNRPDCLSVVGIARETAATLRKEFRLPETLFTALNSENIADIYKVEVKDELCKRYMIRGVKNVVIAPSPGWMQERLLEAGVRPINNIVDITNFVMVELGQPMHAFDSREISSNKIVVERAYEGEKFTTLDEIERVLDADMLNIKDSDTTIGLAGIMGGLKSEIKEDTTQVIFESANFDGTNIRISSKKVGIRTEASGRFEKDLDLNAVKLGMDRACHLVQLLGAGELMQGEIDIYPVKAQDKTLEVDSVWVNNFLGTKISKDDMKKYLDSLEIFTTINGDTLSLKVPSFRGDINIREDVAEEIARIYGYNNIPATIVKSTTLRGGKNKKQLLDDSIVETMISSGFNQAISYSFVSPKIFDKILLPEDNSLRKAVTIKNPLGEDFSIMRTTTVPSMLEALGRNYSKNNEVVRLFEIGKVYIPNLDLSKLPEEKNTITIGMYGNCDYLDLKGSVENILECLGITKASFERESENVTFHSGKTANVFIKKEFVGVVGEIHPDARENYGVDVRCYVAELNLDTLYAVSSTEKKYKPLPKFPAVSRDLALLVEDEVMVKQIEDIIIKAGGNLVETVKLFDVYKGKQIPEGKKSVAYSISYRSETKTLIDDEVNKVHNKILRSLEYQLGAELR